VRLPYKSSEQSKQIAIGITKDENGMSGVIPHPFDPGSGQDLALSLQGGGDRGTIISTNGGAG
jgi:hypothetical protein